MIGEPNYNIARLHRTAPLILIVDDNQDNILFISFIVDALNLKHISANTSGDAINLAINEKPDLILLDMVMPDMDGMEVTRRLKNNSFTRHISIVAVTGLTLPEHQQAIKEAGCDDYICKPFSIEEVESKIASFLNLCLI